MPQADHPPGGRILAITDDPSGLGGLGACLEEAGYRVATVSSLHDGLKLAASRSFQLCLLDGDTVRKLQQVVDRDAGEGPAEADAAPAGGATPEAAVGAPVTLDLLERKHIEAVLAGCPTLDAAARTLGIDSSTLYRKRKAYGL